MAVLAVATIVAASATVSKIFALSANPRHAVVATVDGHAPVVIRFHLYFDGSTSRDGVLTATKLPWTYRIRGRGEYADFAIAVSPADGSTGYPVSCALAVDGRLAWRDKSRGTAECYASGMGGR
ncbi:hypothetical protein [uncultured Jatrophihabitans sp.]|uniref:hypothetical protein n=1 Tax=uncultured Jatrophihabitans sp. TaxID=1610747 RepID=UPI0035CB6698